MIKQQYRVFTIWFFSIVILFYAALASINYYIDPFFIYTDKDDSISEEKISQPYNEILLKLSLFRNSDKRKLIFGDSRGNVFTEDILEEVASDDWLNLSINGATPNELISLVEHSINTKEPGSIDEIILTLPLRLYVDRRTNRYDEAIDLVDYDFIYLTNTLVFKASMAQAAYRFFDTRLKTQKQEGSKDEAWKHWVRHAELKTLDWKRPDRIKQQYQALFERLRDEGIKFTIFLPPIHEDIQAIYRTGMPENWNDYFNFYSKQPETISCMSSEHIYNKDVFNDPYHSNPEFSKMLFTDLIHSDMKLCNEM